MNLIPFKKIISIQGFNGQLVDISADSSIIDIACDFILNDIKGIREDYYVGISALADKSKLSFSFGEDFKLKCIEFRNIQENSEKLIIELENVNLVSSTLTEIKQKLEKMDIKVELTDVGFDAPDIGVWCYSDNYKDDLNVRLDSITVNFSN